MEKGSRLSYRWYRWCLRAPLVFYDFVAKCLFTCLAKYRFAGLFSFSLLYHLSAALSTSPSNGRVSVSIGNNLDENAIQFLWNINLYAKKVFAITHHTRIHFDNMISVGFGRRASCRCNRWQRRHRSPTTYRKYDCRSRRWWRRKCWSFPRGHLKCIFNSTT